MNFKKRISVGLALSLVLSSSSLASALPNELGKTLTDSKEQLKLLQAQIQQDHALKNLKDSDKVRVVVELNGEPVIQIANTKGLKINKMSITEVKSLQTSILKEQQNVQDKIDDDGINIKIINSFTNVANGFSMETTLGEAKKLEGISGIKAVTIANEYARPEPMMTNSDTIINSKETWALGYNGEGTVVAIIDTGVDSSHRDMTLTTPAKAELQIDEVQALASKNNLAGNYRTSKVPYGYNYMDKNDEILDLGPDASMHGMHVAGTVGANGDTEKGGIKGVAPESQLLAMKVFGNNPAMPSTFGDVIVKAIDDSVLLGADVINMSLGSTASYVDDNDLEQIAVNRAVDSGVVMAISAGNSNVFGSGYDNPYASNPDYGVVGSPGLATDSLQVSSIENTIISGFGLEYEINGVAGIAPYTTSGPDMLAAFKGKVLKVVDCGLGGLSTDFTEAVKGNIALIQRGAYNFTAKISNAELAGASGVIVYNNAGGGDGLISMLYPEGGTIPAMFIGNSHGSKLSVQSKISDTTVVLNGKPASAVNPSAGKMSSFTSWGTTPNLDFKPEITAPGGNIWSTANNNSYQNMSGTSMAAPHVAGGSALVLQRVDNEFALTGQARALMAKNLLMSTAKAHVDNGNYQNYGVVAGPNFTSPRRQGAGVMDLQAATTTPAIVTDNSTGESKINLKEIVGNTATFDITVRNFSDKELTYNVDGTVQTDLVDANYTYLQAQNIINKTTNKFPLSFSVSKVVVPKKGTATITGTINLDNAIGCDSGTSMEEMFKNGGYVEGFVTLTDPNDVNPELSIPYVGFKGEWDKAPIIDASIYDKENYSFYGYTSLISADEMEFLGMQLIPVGAPPTFNPATYGDKIAFSPNGDGVNDAIIPVLSYLRNAKELEVEVLDATGKIIQTLTKEAGLNKHYFDGKYAQYSILNSATWNGKINSKIVADGLYTYRVKSKIDFKDARWQNLDFKVNVDTVKPTINSVNYDKSTKILTVVAEDNLASNIFKYVIMKDGVEIASNDTGIFDLKAVDYKTCTLDVYDFARNSETLNLLQAISGEYIEPVGPAEGDKTIPTVMVTAPEFFGVLNSSKVTVTGTVKDVSAIAEFTVNAKNVPLTFDTNTGFWNFSTVVELVDGYHSIMVAARDAANNEIEFAHKVFIDTVAPVIKLDSISEETTKDSMIISGILTDNLPSMIVKVNGNMLENIAPDWSYFDTLPTAEYKLAYTVKLANGENKVLVEALDTAGHVTTQEIIINKVEDKTLPTIIVTAPKFFGVMDSRTVTVTGTVTESKEAPAAIGEFTVNAKIVPLTFDAQTGIWNFSTEVELNEGSNNIIISAKDAENKKSEVAHTVFIDTIAPVIKLDSIPEETNKDSIIISGILTDNLPSLKIIVNDNVLKTIAPDWSYFDGLSPAEYKLAHKVNLVNGDNKIVIKALDNAGHVTTQEVIIKRVEDKTAPTIIVTSPKPLEVLNTSKVTVTGTVKDLSEITEVTVNGNKATLTFDTPTDLWNFSSEVELVDGSQSINISATDATNNKTEVAHKVFVDTTAPTVIVTSPKPLEVLNTSKVTVKGTVKDLSEITEVTVNGNKSALTFDTPTALWNFSSEVALVNGDNKVLIKALDVAKNVTTQEIIIKKVAVVVNPGIPGPISPVIIDKVDPILGSTKLVGSNRYKTAIEVSKSGWVTSNVAVITNGYSFADALVAAPLAANYDAPILLTETANLQADTKAELSRLGVKTVYVVGGVGVVSDAAIAEMSKAGINVIRLAGINRYETSVEVAKHLAKQQTITKVYVSNGYAPADALTVASKAAIDKSPIILVEEKLISKEVLNWLTAQKLKSAYIIGGLGVVSASVMESLNKLTSEDISNNRLGGADRYETNALVVGKFFNKEQTNVYVTESIKLVDALVIAPLAAKTGSPVLITKESLASTQQTVADSMTAKKVIEVGGEVSKSAVKDLIDRLNK